MHLKRINKRIRNKIIAGLLIALSVMGMFIGFKHQKNTIDNLRYELNIKQQVQDRATDYTETTYDKDSIELRFNEIKEYKIFDSEISIKHKYVYEDETFLGFHKKATLVANANIYVQYNVALANAEIEETEKSITIKVPRAYLDKSTVHIVPNTFIRIEDECSHNLLSNYEIGERVRGYWDESIIEKAYSFTKEYFNESTKIDAYTKQQVKDLVETLTNKKVKVEIIG